MCNRLNSDDVNAGTDVKKPTVAVVVVKIE